MPDSQEFDVVVIGAGPVGENVADRAVRGGLTAAIVEAELVGGECSYWACMPSKALLRPGEAVAAARSVAGAREAVSGPLDVSAVLGRRDSFTSHWNDEGQVRWLEGVPATLFRGRGRLAGAKRVTVESDSGTVELSARHAVVVSTGSVASFPPVDGLGGVGAWTTREATSAQAVPESLVVLGGGVAGCELSQVWSTLGSRVTIVEISDHLLGPLEPFAGRLVEDSMREMGIEVKTGMGAAKVERLAGGKIRLTLSSRDAGPDDLVEADEILVAAGRKPATANVGLETVGLEPGSWLDVDDTLRVKDVDGGWLYATGDVNHRALLTHQGKYQARACGDVIAARAKGEPETGDWGPYNATADHHAVTSVVFTNPEVASVGYTEAAARREGLEIRVVDYQIGDVAGASLYADGYKGQARMIVDERRKVIIGITFAGPGVADLLHGATIAVVGEVPLDRLWHAVPAYPSVSEVWLRLLEAYGL